MLPYEELLRRRPPPAADAGSRSRAAGRRRQAPPKGRKENRKGVPLHEAGNIAGSSQPDGQRSFDGGTGGTSVHFALVSVPYPLVDAAYRCRGTAGSSTAALPPFLAVSSLSQAAGVPL